MAKKARPPLAVPAPPTLRPVGAFALGWHGSRAGPAPAAPPSPAHHVQWPRVENPGRGLREAYCGAGGGPVALRGAGRSRCRCGWLRFRVRRVPFRAVSGWAVPFRFRRRLLLWVGVRFVGLRRVRCRVGPAAGGFSLRFFRLAALGRLGACRFWGLGLWFPPGGGLVFPFLRRCRGASLESLKKTRNVSFFL